MSELLLSKRQQTTNVGENMEKREPLYTVGVKINRCSYYGNCRKVLQNIQNQTTIQSSNSTFGYLSEENKNTRSKRYIHHNVHCSLQNNLSILNGEWIKQILYIYAHTHIYIIYKIIQP